MSKSRSLIKNQPSRLLSALLDNPSLPTYVSQLEAPVLNRLVEFLGPEDAGALVVHATNRQLRSIFDETLWASLAPGAPETHRPEEFIRWLLILADEGEVLLAEKLVGLGLDYIAMNLTPLVRVRPVQASLVRGTPGRLEEAEEFQGYFVSPVHYEEWDITRTAMVALDEHESEFLGQVLQLLGRDVGELLLHDITGERRDRKERDGYVTPESATAFLQLIRIAELSSLAADQTMDPVSVRYFAQLGAGDPDTPDPAQDSVADTAQNGPAAGDFEELSALLAEAEIINQEAPLLLAHDRGENPGESAKPELAVKRAVDALQHTDPAAFSAALSQLVYLSNVLIAGTTLAGRRFEQVEAAHAALAVCNLGLSFLERAQTDISLEGQHADAALLRLFRIGWKLMLETPVHVVQLLTRTLSSATFTQRLYDKAWIVDEMSLTLDELRTHVRDRRYEDVKDNLVFLSLVIDKGMTEALLHVLSDYPQYPFDSEVRFLESVDDLAAIDRYIRNLSR